MNINKAINFLRYFYTGVIRYESEKLDSYFKEVLFVAASLPQPLGNDQVYDERLEIILRVAKLVISPPEVCRFSHFISTIIIM